jgi:SAM-dependent methyltransferase
MSIEITGGVTEKGVVAGNSYDKYGSGNPIVRRMMRGFGQALSDLVAEAAPVTLHEIGCGEGYWTLHWLEKGLAARGCDVSEAAISLARRNAAARNLDANRFAVKSIYDLDSSDRADLVLCCEVLEHLPDPERGLEALRRSVGRRLILSVPDEPLWRVLNMARGKYLGQLGNTPGHLQHWSRDGFVRLVSRHFRIDRVLSPLPWTMLSCRLHD